MKTWFEVLVSSQTIVSNLPSTLVWTQNTNHLKKQRLVLYTNQYEPGNLYQHCITIFLLFFYVIFPNLFILIKVYYVILTWTCWSICFLHLCIDETLIRIGYCTIQRPNWYIAIFDLFVAIIFAHLNKTNQ